MSFEDAIKDAMVGMLKNRGMDAVRVNSYKEEERYDGFCETCYYNWTVVFITYITSKGEIDEYEYYGEFSELIQELEANS